MIAFGSNEHLILMASLFGLGLAYWAVRSFWRWWQVRPITRLRADAAAYMRSATADRPAPGPFTGRQDHTGAGSQLPSGSAVATASVSHDRDSAADVPSVESQPAPGHPSQTGPGAGPLPLSVTAASAHPEHALPPCDGQGPTSADVSPPDLMSAGSTPPGELGNAAVAEVPAATAAPGGETGTNGLRGAA